MRLWPQFSITRTRLTPRQDTDSLTHESQDAPLTTKGSSLIRVGLLLGLTGMPMLAPTLTMAATSSTLSSNPAIISPAAGPASAQAAPVLTPQIEQSLKTKLKQVGIKPAIISIKPSKLPSMFEVQLEGQAPLYITADGRYALQGELYDNPSPRFSLPPVESTKQTQSGMPVSGALRTSMLKNMSLQKVPDKQMPLYHSSVPGLIWGNMPEEGPFLTDTSASVITNGEIFVIDGNKILPFDERFEQQKNQYIFSQLDDSQLITYPASGTERALIYVATDVNCPYCRRFHAQIPALNAKGVTVKVIGMPIYEESPEIMRQVWCERQPKARQLALDAAMRGEKVVNKCARNAQIDPLKANKALAEGLPVLVTPMVVRSDGSTFYGSFEDAEFLDFLGLK
ncbi:MAG: DsbC family protein [Psychrobacter sp.]|nr:DsbC family protein [Psychrobacter sp.]